MAEVIQTLRPDVLLVNEFDNAPGNDAGFIAPGSPASGSNAQLFIDNDATVPVPLPAGLGLLGAPLVMPARGRRSRA